MNSTPNRPPVIAKRVIWRRVGSKPQRKRAGRVKMTPLATELDAEPTVCERLASSRVFWAPSLRSARNTATVITATGIDVEIVRPALRPR